MPPFRSPLQVRPIEPRTVHRFLGTPRCQKTPLRSVRPLANSFFHAHPCVRCGRICVGMSARQRPLLLCHTISRQEYASATACLRGATAHVRKRQGFLKVAVQRENEVVPCLTDQEQAGPVPFRFNAARKHGQQILCHCYLERSLPSYLSIGENGLRVLLGRESDAAGLEMVDAWQAGSFR